MATNVFRKFPGFRNEEWVVPAGTQANAVVINDEDGRPAVALTARGDSTAPAGIPGVTGGTIPNGGAGNRPTTAVVGVQGYDFLLTVTGVTAGDTIEGTGTAQGTGVYAVVSGGAVTSLTLTATSNTKIGVIAEGRIINGVAPVSIGVDL